MLKRIWALSMLLLAGVLCCANAFAVETPRVVRVGWFTQPGYQETLADGTRYGYNYEYYGKIKKIDSSNKLIYLNNLKLLFNQITGVTDTK